MKSRQGVVLLLALLCVVALELTAAGLHLAALQQLRAARAETRALQLRLSAEGAVVAAVAAWPGAKALGVPLGGSLQIDAAAAREPVYGVTRGASAERVAAGLFLLRAQAQSPLGETASAGYLFAVADPASELGGPAVRSGGHVSLSGEALLAAGSDSCTDAHVGVQLAGADRLTLSDGARLDGGMALQPELAGAELQAMLPFALADLLSGAQDLPESTVRPEPTTAGARCASELLSNWGEPTAENGGPCTAWFPALSRTGDLLIAEGRGQGVLFVSGDLVITGGARFAGLLLVTGNVRLDGGAAIAGVVFAAGNVTLSDASVHGDYCTVRNALAGVSRLAGPFRLRGRSWIPVF